MKVQTLSRIPIFARLPTVELERLAASLQTCHLPAQTVFIQEGHADEACYILLEGEVEIIKALGTDEERCLGVRQAGIMLGEMSLFSQDATHTASVRSLTPLTVLQITRADFDALLHRQPDLAYEMVRIMSSRLQGSENATIQDLRKKNRELSQAYEALKAAQADIIVKERLEQELEVARRIQRSILPKRLPDSAHYEFGALMIPARAVGGDFYDFISLGENRLGVVVGDVSDKGVPAALFMALSYSLMRAVAGQEKKPGDVLRRVHRHLLEIDVARMYVTLLYGILDMNNGRFSYARAGHPYPILLDRQGQISQFPTGQGRPLGLVGRLVLDEHTISLSPGATLLIYSDGLSEAVNEAGAQLEMSDLQATLIETLDCSTQEICQRLWEKVQQHSGSHPQQDDFTALVVRRVAP